jgi:hypothetical protein
MMLFSAAANDNQRNSCLRFAGPSSRVPAQLEAEVRRVQTEAERARLDGLAHILAIAAAEVSRVAEWERRIDAELNSSLPGLPYLAEPRDDRGRRA